MEYLKGILLMRLFLLLILLMLFTPLFAAIEMKQEWRLTTANISLIQQNAKELKTEGTVLGELLTENKRNLWSLIEEDGKTVLSLVISYKPIGSTKEITQIGFYRAFDLDIQHDLEAKGIMRNPVEAKIAYLKDQPTEIRFLINRSLVIVPPLLTKLDE